jgi:hypothetical protein
MSSSSAISANIATIYSAKATVDMFRLGAFGYAVQKGIIDISDELKGKRGSTISVPKASLLTGVGTGSTGTLDGQEEAINNSAQSMVVDEFCHAVLNPTDLKKEKWETNLEWDDIAQKLLVGYVVSRKDAGFFQQLAGAYSTTISVDGTSYSGTNRSFVTGLNTILAPSTNRIVRAAAASTDEGLTSADTITLDLIDEAIQLLEENQPTAEAGDDGMLDLFVSNAQGKALIQDSAGRIQLYQIGLAEIQGGGSSQTISKSGFSGRKGMTLIGTYRNVRIWACKRVAKGVNSSTSAAISTVQRAILCAQKAGKFASYFGTPTPKNPAVKMSSQMKDYDRFQGTSVHTIDGIVKNQLDSEDEAVVVISTYGA